MNHFQEQYRNKLADVLTALSRIPSGACVGTSLCAMEPRTLLGQMHTLHSKVSNIRMVGGLELGSYPYMQDDAYRDTFTVESMFFLNGSRSSAEKGIASYVPTDLHSVIARRSGYNFPNVLLLSGSPMDEHGYFHCSLCQIWERHLLEVCDLVIIESNPNIPVVGGDTAVHISQVDYVVEVDTPVPSLPKAQLTETDVAIGGYIASLINDGDTIQLGIGSIPDAAAMALMNKQDLGVHTEMLTTSIADMVEAGVVTGRKKTLHNGKIVATFALGEQKLYDMMNKNTAVEILRGEYVNSPFVVAQNDNMVSVNSCVSVDLTGQVNSESIGTRHYSGSGGQVDTAYGAVHARNGRSIIALSSTAKAGTVSAIVPVLAPGAVVTLTRNNVDYVVTEYGIACLKGRNVRERINNLIGIAHPDFRTELRREANRYYS